MSVPEFCTDFYLAGLRVRVTAPREVPLDPNSRVFLRPSDAAPALWLRCEPVEEIALPPEAVALDADRAVQITGRRVTRYARVDAAAAPYLAATYDAASGAETLRVDCCVRADAWPWAAHTQRLWVAVSLAQLLLLRGRLVLHASYIRWQGRGILFMAPSQTGKSTQARLWQAYRGAELINGDKAVAEPQAEGALAHSLPFCGTSGICRGESAPLAAIVRLSQAPEDRVERLRPSQAAAAILENAFAGRAVAAEWQAAVQLAVQLAATTPVYHLACTPTAAAVDALQAALAAEQ